MIHWLTCVEVFHLVFKSGYNMERLGRVSMVKREGSEKL